MKKSAVILSLLCCCFPFFAYAIGINDRLTPPPLAPRSTIDELPFFLFSLIPWAVAILIPLLFLATIILGIRSFFKKHIENKKRVPASNVDITVRLIIPYLIFAAMVTSVQHRSIDCCPAYVIDSTNAYEYSHSCLTFTNKYENIIIDTNAILFLIISIVVAYFMKRNNKEWKTLHTLLIMDSFLITGYLIMAIGEYFCV